MISPLLVQRHTTTKAHRLFLLSLQSSVLQSTSPATPCTHCSLLTVLRVIPNLPNSPNISTWCTPSAASQQIDTTIPDVFNQRGVWPAAQLNSLKIKSIQFLTVNFGAQINVFIAWFENFSLYIHIWPLNVGRGVFFSSQKWWGVVSMTVLSVAALCRVGTSQWLEIIYLCITDHFWAIQE